MGSHDTLGERATVKVSTPSRALIGYMQTFRIHTRGTGIMEREFDGYREYIGSFRKTRTGSLTSMATGKVTGYALAKLQHKGKLFVKVGDDVYDGMVIGEVRDMKDMDAIKRPQFEEALSWIENDEYIEVTPSLIRIRKAELVWSK